MENNIKSSGYIPVNNGTFKIDDVTVCNPTGIKWEEHTLSRAWNDATGIQHKINYRLRRKFIWVYDVIDRGQLDIIYNIMNTKREKTGSTRFEITSLYFNDKVKDISGTFIVEWGTPFKVECIDSMKDLFRLEISFIEPIGKRLTGEKKTEYWNNEIIKIVMKFDNNTTYEVINNENDDKFITYMQKNNRESINYNNIFGSITSNNIEINIFDIDNCLSVNNINSPYYGFMRNGVKIEAFISYDDGLSFEPYGTYYVNSWVSDYFDGMQDITKISAGDELQYILNDDIPDLPAYSGVSAKTLITNVLSGCGIDSKRIKFDESLNFNIIAGVSEDEKVGYFLNEICQALCAVCIIDDSNNIIFHSALSGYNNKYEVDIEPIERLTSTNNSNNIYSRVKLSYDKAISVGYGVLASTEAEIVEGDNNIIGLSISNAIDIAEVKIEDNENITYMQIQSYNAYQNGIDILIHSDSKNTENVSINVMGHYNKTSRKVKYSDINYSDNKRVVSYNMFNRYIQTDEDAEKISNIMAKYIELYNLKISLDSLYTPKITTGDILYFGDGNDTLCGKYKVIGTSTVHGTNYSNNIEIIPLRLDAVWDDNKSWSDADRWLENDYLSLV